MPAAPARPKDVIIRPESFYVAPHVLGLPLARPSRRLVAILLDLCIVAILVGLGGGFLLALAAALAFFRFASKATRSSGSRIGSAARFAFRVFGGLFLFIAVLSVVDFGDDEDDGGARSAGDSTVVIEGASTSAAQAVQTSVLAMQFRSAPDSISAHAAAVGLLEVAREGNLSDDVVRDMLTGIAESKPQQTWLASIAQTVVPARAVAIPAVARPGPDSLALLYAAAARAGETASADTLGEELGGVLLGPQMAALRGEAAGAEGEVSALRAQLEEEENRGFLSTLLAWLDDMGIGFGWTGLYFTAFTALWKGHTPGKKLLGIRVLRLNGQPMTLWMSFERFGGYAAGLVTGLLGFAQILWDKNRQGIHDKITETVVIRERMFASPPIAPPAASATVPARPTSPSAPPVSPPSAGTPAAGPSFVAPPAPASPPAPPAADGSPSDGPAA